MSRMWAAIAARTRSCSAAPSSFAYPPAPSAATCGTSTNDAPSDWTCSFTMGRTSKAETTAPRRRAVASAWSPATPAPTMNAFAGASVPAAVVIIGRMRGSAAAPRRTALYPASVAWEERASIDWARVRRAHARHDLRPLHRGGRARREGRAGRLVRRVREPRRAPGAVLHADLVLLLHQACDVLGHERDASLPRRRLPGHRDPHALLAPGRTPGCAAVEGPRRVFTRREGAHRASRAAAQTLEQGGCRRCAREA